MKRIITLAGAALLVASAASAQQFSDRAPFLVAGPLGEGRVLVGQNKVQYACKISYQRQAAVVSDCVTFSASKVVTQTVTQPKLPSLARQVNRMDEIAAANMALEVLNTLTCRAGSKSIPVSLYQTKVRERLLQELGGPARVDEATEQALKTKIGASTDVIFKYERAKWLIDQQFIGPTRCN